MDEPMEMQSFLCKPSITRSLKEIADEESRSLASVIRQACEKFVKEKQALTANQQG